MLPTSVAACYSVVLFSNLIHGAKKGITTESTEITETAEKSTYDCIGRDVVCLLSVICVLSAVKSFWVAVRPHRGLTLLVATFAPLCCRTYSTYQGRRDAQTNATQGRLHASNV
jgi:hypothetical protein